MPCIHAWLLYPAHCPLARNGYHCIVLQRSKTAAISTVLMSKGNHHILPQLLMLSQNLKSLCRLTLQLADNFTSLTHWGEGLRKLHADLLEYNVDVNALIPSVIISQNFNKGWMRPLCSVSERE